MRVLSLIIVGTCLVAVQSHTVVAVLGVVHVVRIDRACDVFVGVDDRREDVVAQKVYNYAVLGEVGGRCCASGREDK